MVRNTVQAGSLFVGRAAAAFFATVVFTRALGPVGRGQVVFTSNLVGMIALIAGSGTTAALVRMRVERPAMRGELYPAAMLVSAIYGVAAAALYGLALVVVGPGLSPGVTGLGAGMVVIMVIPSLAVGNLTQAMGLTGRLGRATAASLVGSLAYLLAIVGLWISGRLTVLGVLMAFALGTAALPLLLLLGSERGAGRWGRDAVAATGHLLRGSLSANVGAMAVLVLWRADLFLVERLLGDADLGYYSAATAVAEVLLVLVITLRTALLPVQGSSDVANREISALVARVLRLGLAIGAVVSLLFLVGGRMLLIGFYGSAYGRVWTSLALLAPGVILFGLQFPLFDYLSARGANRRLAVLGLGTLVCEVAVDLLVIPAFGFIGAAAVSTATYALLFAGCAVLFAAETGRSWREILVLQRGDIATLLRRVTSRRSAAGSA